MPRRHARPASGIRRVAVVGSQEVTLRVRMVLWFQDPEGEGSDAVGRGLEMEGGEEVGGERQLRMMGFCCSVMLEGVRRCGDDVLAGA